MNVTRAMISILCIKDFDDHAKNVVFGWL